MISEDNDNRSLSLEKQALLKIKKLQAELDYEKHKHEEPIAIVGIGCRFPGYVSTAEQLWQLLCDEINTAHPVSDSLMQLTDSNAQMKGWVQAKKICAIKNADLFDAGFFDISAREAILMDPQQRLLLETSWEACENAGIAPLSLMGSKTGVFIGLSNNDYADMVLQHYLQQDHIQQGHSEAIDILAITGNSASVASGRISHFMGFSGPSYTLDTASSSSLTAIHMACQSLRAQECHFALAGGVNIQLQAKSMWLKDSNQLLSAEGKCGSFDQSANGFVTGDGCGVIALLRLSDAIKQYLPIIAIIRGSAINHNGANSKLGTTSSVAGEMLFKDALYSARLAAKDISYIEASGSGVLKKEVNELQNVNELQDVNELQALVNVYAKDREEDSPLIIGSVKTNIGHSEAASGIAGVIKVALALQHRYIPAHLNFQQLSPDLAAEQVITIETSGKSWGNDKDILRAAVNAFGFNGTNAHIILEQAPAKTQQDISHELTDKQNCYLLTLSARSRDSLDALKLGYLNALQQPLMCSLTDVCYTSSVGRSHFKYRQTYIANSVEQLCDSLSNDRGTHLLDKTFLQEEHLAFLLPDDFEQGSLDNLKKLKPLYDTDNYFKQTFDKCSAIIKRHTGCDVVSILWQGESQLLYQAEYGLPALFAFQYSLARLWQYLGLLPTTLVVSGVGKYVAACLADVLTLEQSIELLILQLYFSPDISDQNKSKLAADIIQEIEQLDLKEAQLNIICADSGEILTPTITQATYWQTLQLSKTVLIRQNPVMPLSMNSDISDCILVSANALPLIETLILEDSEVFYLSGWDIEQSENGVPIDTLAKLYCAGAEINWRNYYSNKTSHIISLPTYQFQRQHYWLNDLTTEDITGTDNSENDLATHHFSKEPNDLLVSFASEEGLQLVKKETDSESFNSNSSNSESSNKDKAFSVLAKELNIDLSKLNENDNERQIFSALANELTDELLGNLPAFSPIDETPIDETPVNEMTFDNTGSDTFGKKAGLVVAKNPTFSLQLVTSTGTKHHESVATNNAEALPETQKDRYVDVAEEEDQFAKDQLIIQTKASNDETIAADDIVEPDFLTQLVAELDLELSSSVEKEHFAKEAPFLLQKIDSDNELNNITENTEKDLLAQLAEELDFKFSDKIEEEPLEQDPVTLQSQFSQDKPDIAAESVEFDIKLSEVMVEELLVEERLEEELSITQLTEDKKENIGKDLLTQLAEDLDAEFSEETEDELFEEESFVEQVQLANDEDNNLQKSTAQDLLEQFAEELDAEFLERTKEQQSAEQSLILQTESFDDQIDPLSENTEQDPQVQIVEALDSKLIENIKTKAEQDDLSVLEQQKADENTTDIIDDPASETELECSNTLSQQILPSTEQQMPVDEVTMATERDSHEAFFVQVAQLKSLTENVNTAINIDKNDIDKNDIAIVGMSCRFPGQSMSPEQFWHQLLQENDAIVDCDQRWLLSRVSSPVKFNKAGLIDQIELFDYAFFGITKEESNCMDPQQRVLLETAWEALERAGYAASLSDKTIGGVFVGSAPNQYQQLYKQHVAAASAYLSTGCAPSANAGRLSHFLGWDGPAVMLDTAHSSALVAVHMAIQSLLTEESDIVLAGSINLILTPNETILLAATDKLSVSGKSYVFDERADGYVRAEGCGFLVMKRLQDALSDRDTVLAVIKGSAVNQDGATQKFADANGDAQERVIRRALRKAGIAANCIDYVETDASGSLINDAIEVDALARVYCQDRNVNAPLLIGSVKTHLGHLESSSGMAGLMKIVLAMQHNMIPAHLNYQKPNSKIAWQKLPVKVNTQSSFWSAKNMPRFAAVSAFGSTGTNAHIILQEAPFLQQTAIVSDRTAHLFAISAQNNKALNELVNRYQRFIETKLQADEEINLADLCFSANTGRRHFAHRLAFVVHYPEDLLLQLTNQTKIAEQPKPTDVMNKVWFFGDKINNHSAISKTLYLTQPVFRESIDQCAELLTEYCDITLIDMLWRESKNSLSEVKYQQPALFALQYSLGQLFKSWLGSPDIVIGYGCGEHAAACLAGVFSLEDGIKLTIARGNLFEQFGQAEVVAQLFADENQPEDSKRIELMMSGLNLKVIAHIGKNNQLISGLENSIDIFIQRVSNSGMNIAKWDNNHQVLSVSDGYENDFRYIAQTITYNVPEITYISSGYGREVNNEITTPDYWVRHLSAVIDYRKAINHARNKGNGLYLNIGTENAAIKMSQQASTEIWANCITPDNNAWNVLLAILKQSYELGVNVQWNNVDSPYQRYRVALPTYPFQRCHSWFYENDLADLILNNETKKSNKTTEQSRPTGLPEQNRSFAPTLSVQSKDQTTKSKLVSSDKTTNERKKVSEIVKKFVNYSKVESLLTMISQNSSLDFAHPLLGKKEQTGEGKKTLTYYQNVLTLQNPYYLSQYQQLNKPKVPYSLFLEMAISVARVEKTINAPNLRHFEVFEPLYLQPSQTVTLQTRIMPTATEDSWRVEVCSIYNATSSPHLVVHACGEISQIEDSLLIWNQISVPQWDDFEHDIAVDNIYLMIENKGVKLGPLFQNLIKVMTSEHSALAHIQLKDKNRHQYENYVANPVLLESCIQLGNLLWQSNDDNSIYQLKSVDSMTIIGKLPNDFLCHIKVRQEFGQFVANNKRNIVADLFFYHPDGTVIGYIGGAQMRYIQIQQDTINQVDNGQGNEFIPVKKPITENVISDKEKVFTETEQEVLGVAVYFPSANQLKNYCLSCASHGYEVSELKDAEQGQNILDKMTPIVIGNTLYQLGLPLIANEYIPAETLAQRMPSVLADYKLLLRRFMTLLGQRGVVESIGNGWRVRQTLVITDLNSSLEQLKESYSNLTASINIFQQCAQKLPVILTGEIDAAAILFPELNNDDLLTIGNETPQDKQLFKKIKRIIACLLDAIPTEQSIRILEVGAGTGTTTQYILENLPVDRVEYLMTDVSAELIECAQKRFKQNPSIKYKTLDVNKSLIEQGVEKNSFDIIIAANMLHVVQDLSHSLTYLGELLASAGYLLFSETINPKGFVDLTFGLSKEWWHFSDKELRMEYPLTAIPVWQKLIEDAGFSEFVAMTNEINPEQVVMLTRKPSMASLNAKDIINGDINLKSYSTEKTLSEADLTQLMAFSIDELKQNGLSEFSDE